jgi:hypothetical protein
MLNNEEKRYRIPAIWQEANHDDGTAEKAKVKIEALEAVQKLDAHDKGSIPLVMDVARKMAKTNATLNYGEIGSFVRDVLKKSRSWLGWYVSLDAVREQVDEARAWAAETRHPLRSAYSPKSLLKVVSDFKQRSNPAPPKQRKNAKKAVSDRATAANLSKIEAYTDEFVAAVLAQANGLPGSAEVFQSTVHDLVAQIRSEL